MKFKYKAGNPSSYVIDFAFYVEMLSLLMESNITFPANVVWVSAVHVFSFCFWIIFQGMTTKWQQTSIIPIYFLTWLPVKILCITIMNIRFNHEFLLFFFSYRLLYHEHRIEINLCFYIKYQAVWSWDYGFQDTYTLSVIYFHWEVLLKIKSLEQKKSVSFLTRLTMETNPFLYLYKIKLK